MAFRVFSGTGGAGQGFRGWPVLFAISFACVQWGAVVSAGPAWRILLTLPGYADPRFNMASRCYGVTMVVNVCLYAALRFRLERGRAEGAGWLRFAMIVVVVNTLVTVGVTGWLTVGFGG